MALLADGGIPFVLGRTEAPGDIAEMVLFGPSPAGSGLGEGPIKRIEFDKPYESFIKIGLA